MSDNSETATLRLVALGDLGDNMLHGLRGKSGVVLTGTLDELRKLGGLMFGDVSVGAVPSESPKERDQRLWEAGYETAGDEVRLSLATRLGLHPGPGEGVTEDGVVEHVRFLERREADSTIAAVVAWLRREARAHSVSALDDAAGYLESGAWREGEAKEVQRAEPTPAESEADPYPGRCLERDEHGRRCVLFFEHFGDHDAAGLCDEVIPGGLGYECTEPLGHPGDCVARGTSNNELCRWLPRHKQRLSACCEPYEAGGWHSGDCLARRPNETRPGGACEVCRGYGQHSAYGRADDESVKCEQCNGAGEVQRPTKPPTAREVAAALLDATEAYVSDDRSKIQDVAINTVERAVLDIVALARGGAR